MPSKQSTEERLSNLTVTAQCPILSEVRLQEASCHSPRSSEYSQENIQKFFILSLQFTEEKMILIHCDTLRILCLKCVYSRGGHEQLFFESAIAIPQLEGSTSAIAIPQLFKKCYSATAIPQSQCFLESATSSPQLESFTSAIFGTFLAVKSGRFTKKKSEVKNLVLLSI